MMNEEQLDKIIRRVPDYPKPGILFYDITSILTNPDAFQFCIDRMVELYKDKKIDAVAAVESRGFLFAAPFCVKAGLPLILVRKKGKLPGDVYRCSYSLEYGAAEVEVHKADVKAGQKVLLVDDLLATGGTMGAARKLLEMGGAEATDVFGVIGLPDLGYEKVLSPLKTNAIITYKGL